MKSVIGGKGKLVHGLQKDLNFGNGFCIMILLLYSYGAMESVCLPTCQEIPVLIKDISEAGAGKTYLRYSAPSYIYDMPITELACSLVLSLSTIFHLDHWRKRLTTG